METPPPTMAPLADVAMWFGRSYDATLAEYHEHPERLPFRVVKLGRRYYVPKIDLERLGCLKPTVQHDGRRARRRRAPGPRAPAQGRGPDRVGKDRRAADPPGR